MAKRSSRRQTEHDQRVKRIARKLKKNGWDVQVDLPGYDRPPPIGKEKHIPDVRARKAGAERLVEVETAETLHTDKRQHEAFRRRAAQKRRTTFQIEEA